MDDLFKTEPMPPLAEALRPRTIDEVIGQSHLLGPGKPLNLVFKSGKPHSMILWGPPGVGKTTLARLTAYAFECEFIALSAVLSGVKDIRASVEQAEHYLQQGKHTILFIDEIHRFNKSQQDALLPFVESGLVTLIGATTENPSFEVNSALLSRSQVYVLKALTDDEMRLLLKRAQERVLQHLSFDEVAIDTLVGYADGDARRFLNLLEQTKTSAETSGITSITADFVELQVLQHPFLGALEQQAQLVVAERLEHVHLGARQQCRIDFERRILGGGADQGDQAGFHEGQQSILLRLVEAVDLVDEQDRVLAARQVLLGLFDRGADVLHARQHGGQGDEFAAEGIGRQARQRGLAHARRAPQDHRMGLAGLEHQVQRLAGAQQMALADDFVDGARAQGFGQWRGRLVFEQVIHGSLRRRVDRGKGGESYACDQCSRYVPLGVRARPSQRAILLAR